MDPEDKLETQKKNRKHWNEKNMIKSKKGTLLNILIM